MNSLVESALELMLAGMGVVFIFLLVLTSITYLLSWVFPEREVPPADATPASSTHSKASPQVLAAIAIAVRKYKENKRNAS